MRRGRIAVQSVLAAVAFFFAADLGFAADWNIQKVDGRDYVTVDNVAAFYRVTQTVAPTPFPTDAPLTAPPVDDPNALHFTLNRREVFVFGLRQWFALPVILAPDGKTALISRLDLVKSLEPLLRPQRTAGLKPVKMVLLDPGHGGHDFGARSAQGFEKDYSLDVCERLKLLLEASGLKTALTRESDIFIPLPQRPQLAGKAPETIFVSVHFNHSDSNPAASGLEVFAMTPRGAPSTDEAQPSRASLEAHPGNAADDPSLLLASAVHTAMIGRLFPGAGDRGVKRARFAVLRRANVPAMLVEGGFLSNAEDSARIGDAAWRQRLAGAIAVGIDNYRALAERGVTPKQLADYRREALPANVRVVDVNTAPTEEAATLPASNPSVGGSPAPKEQ
jgi:N-acetylmuramoyl-L-alanine amidase